MSWPSPKGSFVTIKLPWHWSLAFMSERHSSVGFRSLAPLQSPYGASHCATGHPLTDPAVQCLSTLDLQGCLGLGLMYSKIYQLFYSFIEPFNYADNLLIVGSRSRHHPSQTLVDQYQHLSTLLEPAAPSKTPFVCFQVLTWHICVIRLTSLPHQSSPAVDLSWWQTFAG